MLNDFKEKLNASLQRKTHCTLPHHQHDEILCSSESNGSGFYVDQSTTPPGSPPADLQRTFATQPAAPSAPVAATSAPSILEALANLARQNNSATSTLAPPVQHHTQAQDNSYNVSNAHNNSAQPASTLNQAIPFPPVPPQPVNVPATFASQPQASSNGAQNYGSNQTIPNPFAAVPPVVPGVLDPVVQQQLLLVKALADQGLPPDQIQGILARMGQGLPMLGAGGCLLLPHNLRLSSSSSSSFRIQIRIRMHKMAGLLMEHQDQMSHVITTVTVTATMSTTL